MSAIGLYDVDYKILVATRTGRLYIFSKSSTSGYKVEVTHAIVAVVLRIDKFICCTIDGLLQCYTLKVRLTSNGTHTIIYQKQLFSYNDFMCYVTYVYQLYSVYRCGTSSCRVILRA